MKTVAFVAWRALAGLALLALAGCVSTFNALVVPTDGYRIEADLAASARSWTSMCRKA
jgi:hypothetical protein